MGETPGAIYARRQAELALETAQTIEDEYANAELKNEETVAPVLGMFVPAPKDVKKQPRVVEVEVDRVYVKQVHQIDTKELPQSGDGKWRFSYQTARIMLNEGYNIKRVIEYTGIGYEDLADIPIDSEGYVINSSGDEE
jgi:hypothetical protein